MEDVAKPKGLHLRGAVYYSRVTVPKELIGRFGRKQIWKSLGTANKDEAEALHLREIANWKAAFVEARRANSSTGKATPSAFGPQVIRPNEAAMLARRFFERSRASLDQSQTSPAEMSHEERDEIARGLQTQIATLQSWSHPDTQHWVGEASAQALSWSGLPSDVDWVASPLFPEYVRRALIQLHSVELGRLRGDFSGRVSDSLFAPTLDL
jgi:hypothetical protein